MTSDTLAENKRQTITLEIKGQHGQPFWTLHGPLATGTAASTGRVTLAERPIRELTQSIPESSVQVHA